jgi:predicted dehydrogenase
MTMTRVMQVGLGNWGLDWAVNAIPQVKAAEMVAYVDSSEEALKRLRDKVAVPEAQCFTSLEAALDKVECDLVLGILRTELHYPVARRVLEAGLNVMVEKPFASTVGEAKDLIALASDRNKVLAVSQNYRFFPAPILAAQMVAEEALGRLDLVSVEFRQHAPTVGYRFWDMPDPLLADMAIHHFDLMRMVIGSEPRRLTCRTWNPPGSPYSFDPVATALIEFENGTMVAYQGSWMSGGPRTAWAGEWRMDCTDGDIWWTSRDIFTDTTGPDRLVVRKRGEAPASPKLPTVPLLDRAGTLSAVCAAIDTGKAPPRFSSGTDNLNSLALVAATILSAGRDGAWVSIAEVLQ